jgi:hypothetical protein
VAARRTLDGSSRADDSTGTERVDELRDPVDVDHVTARTRRVDQVLVVAGIVFALAAVIAVVATRVGRPYLPLGDEANIDLRVRDVFSTDIPLVGTYTHHFNHPGPLFYWLLAPLSGVAGGAAWATLVGGALLQGVAIAACGWLAYRLGGVLLSALVLAALALAYSAFPFGLQFLQTWNPNVAFPFFMLFLLQMWHISLGSRWQVVGVAVTGTFLVQTHMSYGPLVAAAALWAAVVVLIDRRRDPEARTGVPPWRTVLLVGAGVLVALWIVPVMQQLTREPGNFSQIYDFLRDSSGEAGGLSKGAGIFAAEFTLPPPWLGGTDDLVPFGNIVQPASLLWLLVPAALLALGFVAAHRTGRVSDRRMLELATVTAIASILAISRVSVDLSTFVFYWRIIAAVFLVVAVAWACLHWIALESVAPAKYAVVGVLLIVTALFFGARARDVIDHRKVLGTPETVAAELFAQLEPHQSSDEPVLVRGLGASTVGFAQGLIDELDRDGTPVRVDTWYGYQYGDGRRATKQQVDEVWYVAFDGRFRSLLGDDAGARVIGYVTPLSRSDDRELISLQRSLARQLERADRPDLVDALDNPGVRDIIEREDVRGVSLADAQRLGDLNLESAAAGGCRCSVIAYPAATAPDFPGNLGY